MAIEKIKMGEQEFEVDDRWLKTNRDAAEKLPDASEEDSKTDEPESETAQIIRRVKETLENEGTLPDDADMIVNRINDTSTHYRPIWTADTGSVRYNATARQWEVRNNNLVGPEHPIGTIRSVGELGTLEVWDGQNWCEIQGKTEGINTDRDNSGLMDVNSEHEYGDYHIPE